jgi:hypothetical protein
MTVVIKVFPDGTWTIRSGKDTDPVLLQACIANMRDNLQDEIDYYRAAPQNAPEFGVVRGQYTVKP